MGNTKKIKKKASSANKNILEIKPKGSYCNICNKQYSTSSFYSDNRTPNGCALYCKNCIQKIAIDEQGGVLTKIGLVKVLEYLNRPYINALWLSIKIKDRSEIAKLGDYIRAVSNHYKDKTFLDSDIEKDIDETEENNEETMYYSEWCGYYTKSNILILNKKYQSYEQDYNLETEHDKDNARKVAKASLMLDVTIEKYRNGDSTESQLKQAQELYDKLLKSAKFNASDRKDTGITCFGQIFNEVEKQRYVLDFTPTKDQEDIYDKLLIQTSNINRSL